MSRESVQCPFEACSSGRSSATRIHRRGHYRIARTNQKVRRYFCTSCRHSFSHRTRSLDYGHKKRDLNLKIASLLVKGVTLRDCARELGVSYTTVYRKFLWLRRWVESKSKSLAFSSGRLQIDEMETIHHTKCKPLSICIVANDSNQLLLARVAEMPAKGPLAEISRKRYGPRSDHRGRVFRESLAQLRELVPNGAFILESDAKPSYQAAVSEVLPEVIYQTHQAKPRKSVEERLHEHSNKRRFDPLFWVNHKCAVLRAQIKRLTRRSWCTTKRVENLQLHLDLLVTWNGLKPHQRFEALRATNHTPRL